MKFLLLYFAIAVVLGLRSGVTGKLPRVWVLVVLALALGAGFSTQTVIG